MKMQGALYVTCLCFHAAPSAALVTVKYEKGKGVMRREKAFEDLEILSDGVFHANALMDESVHVKRAQQTPANDHPCNEDFILGVNNTNGCVDTKYHRPVADEAMCMKAAEVEGAYVEHTWFILAQAYDEYHPKGCFAWHCGQTHNRTGNNYSMCYYWNGNGKDADHPRGAPVCFKAEYLPGTIDTNGGCDDGYGNIMDETLCKEAAECLGYPEEHMFDIGESNFSKHDEYPKGCFIRRDNGRAHFNDISQLPGEPQNPQIGGGTPLCNVTSALHWNAVISTN